MQLSKNFSLSELTKSQTATRLGIDNTPNEEQIENLKHLCVNVLQKVRSYYKKPITPSSGFRSIELCKAIGSSSKSQHAKGEAVDFEIIGVSNMELAKWMCANLDFDQLILEFYDESDPNSGWVHCSYKSKNNRNQVLVYDGKNYKLGL